MYKCALSPGPLCRMQFSKAYTLRRVYSVDDQSLTVLKVLCPAKTKVGRNCYQSTGIALVLGRWTFFLTLKGHHLGFYKKHFAASWVQFIFFSFIFLWFFLCICTSAAPQRPAHGTVPSQVATHLRTDRVCRVLGRSWIRTQDYWFAVRCATIEPPLLHLPLSHLSSIIWVQFISNVRKNCEALQIVYEVLHTV